MPNLQKTDKSFGSVFDTAIAITVLDDSQHQAQVDQARQWLDLQQDKEFTWNKNILDTSSVLYLAYQNEGIDLGEQPASVSTPKETETNCNEDNKCDENFGENSLICPNDCSCGDNICDSSETSSSCSEDCKETGENEELPEETQEETPEEEKQERSFGFLWFILVALILGALGFLAYKKLPALAKKPKEKPTLIIPRVEPKKIEFKGPLNILKPIKNVKASTSKVEEELEKSLREARKLLGR